MQELQVEQAERSHRGRVITASAKQTVLREAQRVSQSSRCTLWAVFIVCYSLRQFQARLRALRKGPESKDEASASGSSTGL